MFKLMRREKDGREISYGMFYWLRQAFSFKKCVNLWGRCFALEIIYYNNGEFGKSGKKMLAVAGYHLKDTGAEIVDLPHY